MDAPDHQKEARVLSTPKELEKGMPLVEKKDPSRGRVIFSLGEMPIKVVYLTPLGNTLERMSHTEVMFRGPSVALVRANSLTQATSKSCATPARYVPLCVRE